MSYEKAIEERFTLFNLADKAVEKYEKAAMIAVKKRDPEFDENKCDDMEIKFERGGILVTYLKHYENDFLEEYITEQELESIVEGEEVVTVKDLMS